jgi:hypothetical protein
MSVPSVIPEEAIPRPTPIRIGNMFFMVFRSLLLLA